MARKEFPEINNSNNGDKEESGAGEPEKPEIKSEKLTQSGNEDEGEEEEEEEEKEGEEEEETSEESEDEDQDNTQIELAKEKARRHSEFENRKLN